MNRTFFVLVFMALSSLAATSWGATPPTSDQKTAPTAPAAVSAPNSTVTVSEPEAEPQPTHLPPEQIGTLKIFLGQGAKVDYLGRSLGLDGWLISKGSAIQVVYTTPDGQATVVGLLYGPDGEVVTGGQLVEAKQHGLTLPTPTTDPTAAVASVVGAPPGSVAPAIAPAGEAPSERLWKQMAASTYITFGSSSAPPLYVFMDPRCHYCHDYFEQLTTQFLPQKSVQLRVVPVGILGENSIKEASGILSASDPAAAWTNVENGDTSALPTSPQAGVQAKLDANRALMNSWNMKGTPGSVYRGKDGKVKLVYGVPNDLTKLLADLSGP